MEQFGTSSKTVPSMIPFKKQNLKRGREVDSGDTLDESRDLNKIVQCLVYSIVTIEKFVLESYAINTRNDTIYQSEKIYDWNCERYQTSFSTHVARIVYN